MAETIKDLLVILIGSSLVSNVVLSQFLGLCPFLGVSKKVDTAVGMGNSQYGGSLYLRKYHYGVVQKKSHET